MTASHKAQQLLDQAELVAPAATVQAALDRLAGEIGATLGQAFPLVLPVMGGAVVFAGQLLPRLAFPLEFDYLHVTRYRDKTRGGEMEWRVLPGQDVAGRTVLVLDDILDEGETLAAIRDKLLDMGAARVWSAVLTDKANGLAKPIRADFVGLVVPDRFVFGCGMDVYGLWRNLPAIYAMRPEAIKE
ncbi:MAG: hypoxanthine-guanine phosphoribosyltransferase [Pseudomonadota bacterium]|jgi:hypoxanthine phosphoribosyltransferase